ncbi:MAG: hypothetical protein R2940_08810 [Syntrophotaleaceae bacterium]
MTTRFTGGWLPVMLFVGHQKDYKMDKHIEQLIEKMTTPNQPNVDPENQVSWSACAIAEKLNDLYIIDDLLEYLPNAPNIEQEWVPYTHKSAAYYIIGKISKNNRSMLLAEKLLDLLLREPNVSCKFILLEAIAEMPRIGPIDVSSIFPLLRSDNYLIQRASIYAVSCSTKPMAESAIINLLEEPVGNENYISCYGTLSRIGTERAIPYIEKGLNSSVRHQRVCAQLSIDSINRRLFAQQKH